MHSKGIRRECSWASTSCRPSARTSSRPCPRSRGTHVTTNGGADTASDRYVVVTDDNVAGYYLEQVKAVLVQAGLSVFSKVVPSGEVYKTRATKETVENWYFA